MTRAGWRGSLPCQNLKYEFKVLILVVNAFALPGGYVYFISMAYSILVIPGFLPRSASHYCLATLPKAIQPADVGAGIPMGGLFFSPDFRQYAERRQQGMGCFS